jgi:hypothetical protein
VQRRLWHPPLEQRGGHEQVALVLAPPALSECSPLRPREQSGLDLTQ